MAAVINDRDTLLLGAEERTTGSLGSDFFLQANSTGFTVNSSGVASPSTITITAVLINLTGTATFAATGGSVTDNHDNTATIAYNTYTGQTATVTATLGGITRSVTIGSISGGTKGDPGAPGMQYKDVSLYQWSTATPDKPTGNSSWSWVNNVNAAYSASDGWATIDNLPQNPGGTGVKLYTATVSISAPGNTEVTIVSYASAVVQALSINGNNGISGTMSHEVVVYRWDTNLPTGPVGTVTLKWSDRTFAAPNGWEITPSVPPSQGLTRYAARLQFIDVATAITTTRNWNDAAIYVAAASGNNGSAGPSGASATIAYAASSSFGDTTAPAPTTGKNSVPLPNSGGIVGTYSLTVPTVAVGQRMYQTDGIYDPITNKVTWSAPYWSVFKAGSLAAITAIMGKLTITDTISDANGNWSIDGNGHMRAKSWELIDPQTGKVVIQAGSSLNKDFAAPGTLNSDISVGGRNLAEDSAFEGRLRPWTQRYGANNLHIETGSDGRKNLVFEADNGDNYVDGQGPWIPVTPGHAYVISCEFASAGAITSSSSYFYTSDGGAVYLPLINNGNSGGARARFSSDPWTCPAGITGLSPRFGIRCSAYSWMRVYNFDVQEGNKAAAWSPAPEDLRAIADAAAAVAAVAKDQADAANNAISNISNDNVLSRSEKSELILKWAAITGEASGIANQADALGVNRDAFWSSYYALNNYLPAGWNDLSTDTPIDGNAFRTYFADYYSKRQALLNAFAAKNKTFADAAATTSTWAGTTGPGKPQDNATVGADSSNLRTGTGRPNLLERNTLPTDLSTFSTYFSVGGEGPYIARGGEEFGVYSKDRRGSVWVHAFGTPSLGSTVDIYRNDRVKVVPGQRYEFGVSLSTHRCKAYLAMAWYDANGAYMGEAYGNIIENNPWAVTSPWQPPRSTFVLTPPDGARSITVFVRQEHNGGNEPYTFASEWYAAEALPGQTEPSPYSASPLEARDIAESAQAGLADKLSQTAGGVMQGQVTLQTSGAIVAGNASWGAPGYGGSGTVMSPYGFACVKNGVPKMVMTSSGDLYYSGELYGAYGTFGAVRITDGGTITSGAYTSFASPPAGGGTGWAITPQGLTIGNYNDGRYVTLYQYGDIETPSFRVVNGQVTIENPIIVNPDLRIPALNVSVTQTDYFRTAAKNAKGISTQSAYVTVSGGSGNYKYEWTAIGPSCYASNPSATNCAVIADGRGLVEDIDYLLQLKVTDLNTGKIGSGSANFTISYS